MKIYSKHLLILVFTCILIIKIEILFDLSSKTVLFIKYLQELNIDSAIFVCIYILLVLFIFILYRFFSNLKLGKVLSNTSSRLINPVNFNKAIELSLRDIGENSKADRVYVYLFDDECTSMINVHEWCATGIDSRINEIQNITCDSIPFSMKKLNNNEILMIKDVKKLPYDASTEKSLLQNHDVRSLISLPLYNNSNLIGFIGFDNIKSRKIWRRDQILVLKAFAEILSHAYERKLTDEVIQEKNLIFKTIFDSKISPIMIIDKNGRYVDCNEATLKFLECSREEILSKTIYDFCPTEYLEKEEYVPSDYAKVIERPYLVNGKIKTLLLNVIPIEPNGKKVIYGIGQDITEIKSLEISLMENEQHYKSLFENNLDAVYSIDLRGNITALNKRGEKLLGIPKIQLIGTNFLNIVPEDLKETALKNFQQVIDGIPQYNSYSITLKDGTIRHLNFMTVPIIINNEITGIYGIAKDVTEQKTLQEEIMYSSSHDELTGLFNRDYFEKIMNKIQKNHIASLGIIIGDVDGLKLINDTLGHCKGDKLLIDAANAIKSSFRENDVVARIGGDEFGVLLWNITEDHIIDRITKIKESIALHNEKMPDLPLSISLGFAIEDTNPIDIRKLYKEADDNMYREKLNSNSNGRRDIVSAINKMLEAKDIVTKEHVDRITFVITRVAAYLRLPDHKIKDLQLLSKFHDIGKVGITDTILNKKDKLTFEEYTEMKRHSEIGYRITNSVPNLHMIADLVLKHHERWDGKGYPLGLKGEEIPYECRLFSIIDSFDVITHARPYKEALSVEEGLKELRECAGTQFDPDLALKVVDILKVMNEKDELNEVYL